MEAKNLKEAKTPKEAKICVKLDSLISKKELFALKNATTLADIYIQNDLTSAEQEADFQLRKFVREERDGGKKVKFDHNTAVIGNSHFRWNPISKQMELS